MVTVVDEASSNVRVCAEERGEKKSDDVGMKLRRRLKKKFVLFGSVPSDFQFENTESQTIKLSLITIKQHALKLNQTKLV